MVSTIENTDDKSFFLCKYFAGWHLARLSSQWLALRDNSLPSSFEPTTFYSSCLDVMSRLDLATTPLSSKAIYLTLNKDQSPPPSLHRTWTPYLGPGFSLSNHWAKVRDPAGDNKMNDLFWLITHRAIKVRDAMKRWGYIDSDRCAFCNRKETVDHCFLNCIRVKRVWAHFQPTISALLGYHFVFNLVTVFFFLFPSPSLRKSHIAQAFIKNIVYAIWVFRNKSTFHNGREQAPAVVKFALHSIKGRVKVDFHRLPRNSFNDTWGFPNICYISNETLFFCF